MGTKPTSRSLTFAPPTLPPEADTHLLSGENKISPLLLDDQTSKFTIPETLLSPTNFYQTTQNDEGLQIQNPSFRQSDNQDFENDSQPRNTTITIFLKRPALLIGLVLGAISGVILMVVSHWSVQIVSPTPKVQDLQLHKHVSP